MHGKREKIVYKESSNCCITGCSSTSVVVTTVASTEELLHVFSKRGFTCNGAIRIPTALCKTHYHIVYDDIQSHAKSCATCGIRLKPGNHRPCQQPEIIQAHLRENTGFQGEICGSDPVHVCMSCYKSHQVILHHTPTVRPDSHLRYVITHYCHTLSQSP